MVLHTVLSSINSNLELVPDTRAVAHAAAKVSYNLRGTWLLQEAVQICDPARDNLCYVEKVKVAVVLISLCSTIVLVICAFTFFREDKEEQITPLCPQLVVKDAKKTFRLPLGTQAENLDVVDDKDPPNILCKVSMDWPDPFRGSPHGVAATVRLHKREETLATVVARNVAVVGQGLALCRTGCEIFGFVEPDGDRYHVRHRTGVHLLTLHGDFDKFVEGVNPVGSSVCTIKYINGECVGEVVQHVDAGLVICALMATHVHRRLTVNVPPPWPATGINVARPMPVTGKAVEEGAPPDVVSPPEFRGEAIESPSVPPTGIDETNSSGSEQRMDETETSQVMTPPAAG